MAAELRASAFSRFGWTDNRRKRRILRERRRRVKGEYEEREGVGEEAEISIACV